MKKGAVAVVNPLMFNNKNYFEIFTLEPSFVIDQNDLEIKYLEFQKRFHPDSLISDDLKHQVSSISDSILINQAYQILKNPLKRAAYLLKLQGIDIDAESPIIKPDREIIIAILELREKVAEMINLADDKEQIKKSLIKKIKEEIKLLMNEFSDCFSQKDKLKAAQKLIRAKYLDKILIDLKLGK